MNYAWMIPTLMFFILLLNYALMWQRLLDYEALVGAAIDELHKNRASFDRSNAVLQTVSETMADATRVLRAWRPRSHE